MKVQLKHWQDAVNLVVGLLFAASPWLLDYQAHPTAMWSALISGLALAATALGAVLVPRAWEEWTEGALGLWMVVSPWVLGFTAERNALYAAVTAGVIAMALAAWTLATDKDYTGAVRQEA